MPPHDHERPTLYLGASLAFERTAEHKSFRIPGTPVSSVNTGWEASEISIRDSIRSATKLDNFCGAGATIFAPIRHATVASPGVRHRDSDYGAQAAGLLLALCHWRACQQQALRDPRSILVDEW